MGGGDSGGCRGVDGGGSNRTAALRDNSLLWFSTRGRQAGVYIHVCIVFILIYITRSELASLALSLYVCGGV